jgi:hypothetical protein
LSTPGNLSALVFFPIGNKSWAAPEDPNQLELYGADGALLKDSNNKNFFVQVTGSLLTISNKAGTVVATNNGTLWEFKGPAVFDNVVTMKQGLQLAGNIVGVAGQTYAGNIATSGGVEAGVGTADHVTVQGHSHPSNGAPPTPGA